MIPPVGRAAIPGAAIVRLGGEVAGRPVVQFVERWAVLIGLVAAIAIVGKRVLAGIGLAGVVAVAGAAMSELGDVGVFVGDSIVGAAEPDATSRSDSNGRIGHQQRFRSLDCRWFRCWSVPTRR